MSRTEALGSETDFAFMSLSGLGKEKGQLFPFPAYTQSERYAIPKCIRIKEKANFLEQIRGHLRSQETPRVNGEYWYQMGVTSTRLESGRGIRKVSGKRDQLKGFLV